MHKHKRRSRAKSQPSKQLTRRKQLLKTLTDNPSLPAFVESLPTPVLHRLIEHVGLRDAGHLVALTTTDQLRGLFEVALWESLRPGDAEELRPERFLDWLEVMLDVGSTFTAERLIELGEAFVVVNIAPLVHIVDREVAVEHRPEPPCFCVVCELSERDVPFEAFDDYIVTPVHDDEWETVRMVLNALDDEDRDFLNRVLARVSPRPTARGFVDTSEPLLEDETHDRRERRERRGYMTPQRAAAFLSNARAASVETLAAAPAYDEVTRSYFEQLATAAASDDAARERAAAEASANETRSVRTLEMRALEAALVEAEIVSDRAPLLLEGPRTSRAPAVELVDRLDRMRFARPAVFAARLSELAYLANVLMAARTLDGRRFEEAQAAQLAMACANLGLDRLLDRDLDPMDRAMQADDLLDDAPGVVRLFAVGWNVIQSLPTRCATALIETLRSDPVRERLERRRWILAEVESALSQPDILKLVEEAMFEEVGDSLVLLSLVLDARACQCLRSLIADVPRYPVQLDLGFRRAEKVAVTQRRFFTRLDELDRVEELLDGLERLVKS
jgi:hypothetical protein